MAGHADLAAAGFNQHLNVEVGPLLDRGFEPGGRCHRPGEGGAHKQLQMRTPVLARFKELDLAIGMPLLVLLLAVLALEQWRNQLPPLSPEPED